LVVVKDAWQTVMLNEQRLNRDFWDTQPVEQRSIISTGRKAAATIRRCAFRELQEADVRQLVWP
jgi:hypothetical protein